MDNKNELKIDSDFEKEKKDNSNKITFKDVIITLIISITISFALMGFFRVTVVNGHSMDNSLFDGERLILSVRAYKNEEPAYKDIVVVQRDDLSVKYLIKRVIGTPGDKITIKDNKLYINDKLTYENYILEDMVTEDLEIEIPEGKIFVMGDNRNNSLDSRNVNIIGLIDYKDEVLGKAVFSISNFKSINN